MAFGVLLDRRKLDATPLYPATTLPVTTGALISSSFDNAMANNRFISQGAGERDAFDTLYAPVEERLNAEDPNYNRNKLVSNAQQYYSLKKSKALGDRYATSPEEAKYAAYSDYLAGRDDITLPSPDEVRDLAVLNAKSSAEQFQQDQMHYVGTSPRMAAFLGEAGAVFRDPVQLAAMIGSAPVAITTRLAATAATEAVINLAIDAPLMAVQASWYKQQGRELTADEIAANLTFSALLGGGLGLGMSGLYKFAGGTETRFLTGPNAYAKQVQDQIKLNWAHTLSLDDSNKIKTTGVPANVYTYTVPINESPFGPRMNQNVPNALYRMADNPQVWVLPETRYQIMALADNLNFRSTNSTEWFIPDTVGQYQFSLNRLHTAEISQAHSVNMRQALEALLRGETPKVEHKIALTMELELANGPARVTDLKALREGKVELSTKSKNYFRMVQSRIREVMQPRLEALVKSVELPEDRVPVKPAMDKPSLDVARIEKEELKLAEDSASIKGETARLNKQEKARKAYERAVAEAKANKEPKPKILGDEKLLTEKEIAAASKKLRDTRLGLPARKKALADARKQWSAYENSVFAASDINQGIKAEADLKLLAEGKIPASAAPLKKQLDATYTELAKSPEILDAARKEIDADMTAQFGRKSTPFSPAKAFELDSVVRPIDDAQVTREAKAAVEEARRLDQNMTFTIENEYGELVTTTMREQLHEIDMLNDAVDNANICARGAPTE